MKSRSSDSHQEPRVRAMVRRSKQNINNTGQIRGL